MVYKCWLEFIITLYSPFFRLPPYYLSISIVLLIATYPFYKADTSIHTSSYSFTWRRYIWRKTCKNLIWRKNNMKTSAQVMEYQMYDEPRKTGPRDKYFKIHRSFWTFFCVCYNITHVQKPQTVADQAMSIALVDFRNKAFL